jgi:hypothetical protein
MAETSSRCLSCGGPLPSAPSPERVPLRCPRCGVAIRVPEGQQPTAGRHDRASPSPSGALLRSGAGAPAWWKTALAAVIASVLGVPVGAVAGVLLWIVAEELNRAGLLDVRPPGADSTGMPVGIFVFGFYGAVVGFLLGLAIPWFWHAWKFRNAGPVLGLAGAVLGIIVFGYYGAVVGLLLGIAIPPIWKAGKLRLVGWVLGGGFAGAGAGVLLWILAWVWASWHDWEMKFGIVDFGSYGAVVGFLLGLAIPMIWHGWKLLTTTRQSSKNPVKLSSELGPLGEGDAASDPRG